MLRSRRIPRLLALAVLLLPVVPSAAQPKDNPKCEGKEHPLFTRMPGYFLSGCEEKQFAQFKFPTTAAGKRAEQAIEGHFYKYVYRWGGEGKPSGLQVGRNYANAATASGGEVLFSEGQEQSRTTMRFSKGGKETWAFAQMGGLGLTLIVVEAEAMKQDVSANAEALKGGLAANGHVELAGIFFDTGKSELKPESDASLAELEKLLKAQPQLALWVVGHTDSVGTVESNLSLSQARAAAVIKALAEKRGIDAQRLAPFGNGPYAPVATNASEEGRARNRRVELVAR